MVEDHETRRHSAENRRAPMIRHDYAYLVGRPERRRRRAAVLIAAATLLMAWSGWLNFP